MATPQYNYIDQYSHYQQKHDHNIHYHLHNSHYTNPNYLLLEHLA